MARGPHRQGHRLVTAAVSREGPWGTDGLVTQAWRRDGAGSGGRQAGAARGPSAQLWDRWQGDHRQPACPAAGMYGLFFIQTEVKAGKKRGGLSQEVRGTWASQWAVQIPTRDSGCTPNLGLSDLAM